MNPNQIQKTKYSFENLASIRDVKITSLLGIKDYGRKQFIRCPIHSERTASMVLYPDNGFFCFGCGASGKNAIDFIMATGCTFIEAIDELKKYVI